VAEFREIETAMTIGARKAASAIKRGRSNHKLGEVRQDCPNLRGEMDRLLWPNEMGQNGGKLLADEKNQDVTLSPFPALLPPSHPIAFVLL
jgi:hypothetical protein